MIYTVCCVCDVCRQKPIYYFMILNKNNEIIIVNYYYEKYCHTEFHIIEKNNAIYLILDEDDETKIDKTIEYDDFEHIDKIRKYCEENDFILVGDEPIYK